MLGAEARRKQITLLLLDRETVTVRELAARFGVSAMTVHRDLDLLEAHGVLRKVHGGATAEPSSLYESSHAYRLGSMTEAKRSIARRAAREVSPGSSVLIDDSTTCLELVPFLARLPQLTIITNFLTVVERLKAERNTTAKLILLGGEYDEKYHSLLGILAEHALTELRVDRCFLSVSAVDVRDGIFHQEPHQARIKRLMTQIAAATVLLVDSTKVGKRALHRIVGLDALDLVVVDDGVDPADVAALRAAGRNVVVAPGGETDEDGHERDGDGDSRE